MPSANLAKRKTRAPKKETEIEHAKSREMKMNQNVENRQRKQVNQWECNRNLEISIAHHDRLPFHQMERWGDVGEEKKDHKDFLKGSIRKRQWSLFE